MIVVLHYYQTQIHLVPHSQLHSFYHLLLSSVNTTGYTVRNNQRKNYFDCVVVDNNNFVLLVVSVLMRIWKIHCFVLVVDIACIAGTDCTDSHYIADCNSDVVAVYNANFGFLDSQNSNGDTMVFGASSMILLLQISERECLELHSHSIQMTAYYYLTTRTYSVWLNVSAVGMQRSEYLRLQRSMVKQYVLDSILLLWDLNLFLGQI